MTCTQVMLEKFFAIPVTYTEIVNVNGTLSQIETTSTWGKIFDEIRKKHYHTEIVGKSVHTCPHAESLYDHLVSACEHAWLFTPNEADRVKNALCALLHDIGKVGTLSTFSRDGNSHTSFKGHSLCGGAMIRCLYNDELHRVFGLTRADWEDIALCADCHMCGYFPTSSRDIASLNINTFQIQPPSVKAMLGVLRHSDQHGKTPHPDKVDEYKFECETCVTTHDEFVTAIHTPFSASEFVRSMNPGVNGIMIILQGLSGGGKTTVARLLAESFGNEKLVVVTRDDIITRVASRRLGKHISYIDAVTDYHAKRGLDKTYTDEINKKMVNAITEGLHSGKIVVVDTLASRHPDSAYNIIGEHDCVKFSIWVPSLDTMTEEMCASRNGMTLAKQLSITSERSVFTPFGKTEWSKLVSIPEGGASSVVKPHFSFGVKLDHTDYLAHFKSVIESIHGELNLRPRLFTLSETMDMAIHELVHGLWLSGVKMNASPPVDAIRTFFKSNYYTVSVVEATSAGAIVVIKYIDGINKLYTPRWSRQARGIALHVNNERCVSLKDTLQRGIEIYSHVHKMDNISGTQDVASSTDYSAFDANQRALLSAMQSENDVPFNTRVVVTSKVDGSLLIVNAYENGTERYEIIRSLLTTQNLCYEGKDYLFTISTQGTLFMGQDMMDYFITSVYGDLSLDVPDASVDVFTAWDAVKSQFCAKLETWMCNMQANMYNFAFESVCKDRRTYKGTLHTELACGYDRSFLSYLGMHVGDGRFVPHFEASPSDFMTPYWRDVKSSGDLSTVIRDLHSAIVSNDVPAFLTKHFASNESPFDAEGFVVYYYDANGNPDYNKLKSSLYYEFHNVSEKNIGFLTSLPDHVGKYFPVLARLKYFVNESRGTLTRLAVKLYETLHARKEELIASLPEKMRASLNTPKYMSIVVNQAKCCGKIYDEVMREVYVESLNSVDVQSLCHSIVMEIEKTKGDDVTSRATVVLNKPNSPIVSKFYDMTMGK